MRGGLGVVIMASAACLLTACNAGEQEACQHAPQFRVDGVLYGGTAEKIATALLDQKIGDVVRPAGADGCDPFTLADGEGLLGPGSVIYTVDGVPPSAALAVVDPAATTQPLMYRVLPTSP